VNALSFIFSFQHIPGGSALDERAPRQRASFVGVPEAVRLAGMVSI
jgi:hypothetical protein